MLTADQNAFLRQIEVGPKSLETLNEGRPVLVEPTTFINWLRAAYAEGRSSAKDHFVWHDVGELVDARHGL